MLSIIFLSIISILSFFVYSEYKINIRLKKDNKDIVAENNILRENLFTLSKIDNPDPYQTADKFYYVFRNKSAWYSLTQEGLDEVCSRGLKHWKQVLKYQK